MFRSVNSKKQSNDRFIPRRLQVTLTPFENQTTMLSICSEIGGEAEFVNVSKILHNRNNYQNTLRNILLPLDLKILNFFPPKKFLVNKLVLPYDETWPVKPRKKPVIGPPETILDMPQFDSHICHHVADWSSRNCLATIFEHEVHMWYPDSEFLRSVTETQKRVQHCVKWRNDGKRFAVGLFPNKVGVWDILGKKLICETFCCMFCEIFCLEWIRDDYLITGCSKGFLKMHTSNFQCLTRVRNVHDSIINITSSCTKTYIATSGMDKTVVVWKMPEMEPCFQIRFKCVARALAWHPWKNFILAIGTDHCGGSVVLWNVNNQKQIAHEETVYKNSSIDCLSFNPITAELVVSYFVRRGNDMSRGSGVIAVLSNINTVMEELHIHTGPIPYLLWGSGGTVLASASADENLCIWNFFGANNEFKKSQGKRPNNRKHSEYSNLFRPSIR